MNKITPLILALSLIFASCSSNENEGLINTQENLLKSYTLKRDANGAYSIDFKTTNNTDVTTVKNVDASNEIILSEANHNTENNHRNDFAIENDQLKIGFLNTENGIKSNINIKDSNIKLQKSKNYNFLSSYKIDSKENNEYELNFEVFNDVVVDFSYNYEKNRYEVHLKSGTSKTTHYNKNFIKNEGEPLKIFFINHKFNNNVAFNATLQSSARVYRRHFNNW